MTSITHTIVAAVAALALSTGFVAAAVGPAAASSGPAIAQISASAQASA
ncbi:hypothetical protein RCO27_05370 [Sphingosinicella sp. LHD-64]|nr:hypothetical protein [Sphingosinicella sp. LHD-64]MDQ8755652.1 hypothetical protein [Sphingosinicella sp. LHD-64]